MTATTESAGPADVRFGRKQSKGLLLGLSGIRIAAVAAGLIVFVLAVFSVGIPGLVVSFPIWAALFASAFVPWHGAPLVESLPVVGQWSARRANKQTKFLARASAPRPAGTMALPGDLASLRFHEDLATGAVMVHDPYRNTLSAILHLSHPAYVLLAPDDQARRVGAWSRTLAGLAATGTTSCVQVMEATLPDPGHGIRGWWAERGIHDDSWASREYEALMETAAPSSSTHRTTLTLVLDMKKASRQIRDAGRGITGAAAVLRGDMHSMEQSLRTAELRPEKWLSAQDLAVIIRQAYDPAAGSLSTSSPGADLSTAGPVGVDEHWDYLRHDSAYSTVLWISEWPRIDVAPSFLHAMVFVGGVRKTISLIAKPLGTAEALREIRKEKVEYLTEAAQKAKIGQIAALADDQEFSDVLDRERALISGHADMRFSGFIAVTAPDRDSLTTAVSSVERAATQSGCETRILYGQQAQAFGVAALPLGRSVA